jgi:hypothetical protein
MQVFEGSFAGDFPPCGCCRGKTHRHGRFTRFASCDGPERRACQRFLCPPCGRTLSVIPKGMLPYRSLPVRCLQAGFDHRSGRTPRRPKCTEATAGAVSRAWKRLASRLPVLCACLGQMLRPQPQSAESLWKQMRQTEDAEEWLRLLARKFQISLLADYRTLHGWWESG